MLQRLVALAQHHERALQCRWVAGCCTKPGPLLFKLRLLSLLGTHPFSNALCGLRRLRRLCIQAFDGSLSRLNLLYVNLKAADFLVERHQVLVTSHPLTCDVCVAARSLAKQAPGKLSGRAWIFTDQVIREKTGEPGHRNIGRSSCLSVRLSKYTRYM